VQLALDQAVRIERFPVMVAPYAGPHRGYLPLTLAPGVALSPALGVVLFRIYPAKPDEQPQVCGPRGVFRIVR
jgi:hypothetical protein